MLPAVASTMVAARLEPAVALGGLDHRQRDAVLDRAAGVLALQLDEQPARPGVEPGDFDHRRIADQGEHAGAIRRRGEVRAWDAPCGNSVGGNGEPRSMEIWSGLNERREADGVMSGDNTGLATPRISRRLCAGTSMAANDNDGGRTDVDSSFGPRPSATSGRACGHRFLVARIGKNVPAVERWTAIKEICPSGGARERAIIPQVRPDAEHAFAFIRRPFGSIAIFGRLRLTFGGKTSSLTMLARFDAREPR